MEQDTALRTVNYFTRHFSGVEHVTFFGGEPSMNPDLIRIVCEYYRFLAARGVIERPPRFGVTTNGFEARGLLDLVRRYGLGVCVSLDGPAEIHDRLRVARTGGGTHAAVVRFVHTLLDSGLHPEFECTYTAEHVRLGITVKELMAYFHSEFRCRTLHCPVAAVPPGDPLYVANDAIREVYCEAISASVRNLVSGVPSTISIAARLLRHLAVSKPIAHYCPAGHHSLAVDACGRVFACFMLMATSDLALGSVRQARGVLRFPPSVRRLLRRCDKEWNRACRRCGIRALCFGCAGEDLVRIGEQPVRSSLPGRSPLCELKRAFVGRLFSELRLAGASPGQLLDPVTTRPWEKGDRSADPLSQRTGKH